jgi:hypothetical protein
MDSMLQSDITEFSKRTDPITTSYVFQQIAILMEKYDKTIRLSSNEIQSLALTFVGRHDGNPNGLSVLPIYVWGLCRVIQQNSSLHPR